MNFKLNINICYVTARSLQAFAISFVVVVYEINSIPSIN